MLGRLSRLFRHWEKAEFGLRKCSESHSEALKKHTGAFSKPRSCSTDLWPRAPRFRPQVTATAPQAMQMGSEQSVLTIRPQPRSRQTRAFCKDTSIAVRMSVSACMARDSRAAVSLLRPVALSNAGFLKLLLPQAAFTRSPCGIPHDDALKIAANPE